ncbi:TPA: DEAD/DEAH box helicase [bacterium]|nr:DEAD/DEAH box helicase [bacterium]
MEQHWEAMLFFFVTIPIGGVTWMSGGGGIRVCGYCNNTLKRNFHFRKNTIYCRRCIRYINAKKVDKYYNTSGNYEYYLDYSLTKSQKSASEFVLENINNKNDVAINAVCGAGKTEIIYDLIRDCLKRKVKIGIAIPRKDVVIELVDRLKKDFKGCSVIGVYGGNNTILEADIIIFTTHQAHRYQNYFEVLVIDEVDAFPYKGNDLLASFISKCCNGNTVYLSATMPEHILKDNKIKKYYLNRRYHGFDLPVPEYKISYFFLFQLKKFLRKHQDKLNLIYFPTIKLLEETAKKFGKDIIKVHSKIEHKNEVLEKVKLLDKGVVFTTSILERGITLKGVQVLIYNSDHPIFDKDMLIQICGRVGRKTKEPSGEIIYLGKSLTKSMRESRKIITGYNG